MSYTEGDSHRRTKKNFVNTENTVILLVGRYTVSPGIIYPKSRALHLYQFH